jgi:hypothetical protein
MGDLLRHPAFAGFARLLLPWDDRAYDEQIKLSAIGPLLPYHSHIDAASTVGALNRCRRDAVSLDVRWRPDNGHAHIGTDAHRDHVLGDLLAQANARVVAGCNDVDQTIVDDDLDLDVGVVRQERAQGGL